MDKKKNWQIVWMIIVVAALFTGISLIINRNESSEKLVPSFTQTEISTITIEGLYTDKNIQFSSPQTVLGILKQLDGQDEKVQLLTKEYTGLGILVESMAGKTNGTDNKYWQYKVNGVMPQIGADKYEIKNGDVIEWYFDKSEF